MVDRAELLRRLSEYCRRAGLQLGPQLGYGVHGTVFTAQNQSAPDQSAVKVHERERFYRRERDVYRRLADDGVESVLGFDVPRMLNCDDELWVIEMTIASPPFVLDFAGAYLDEPPDYPTEVLAEWEQEKREQFGDRWPTVQAVLRRLQGYGVFLADVTPNNIRFAG
jgi:hypothetical protein